MNILYLYSEVMGYTMAVVNSLIKDHGVNVHIVYWDQQKRTPYELPELIGVTYYKRSEYNLSTLSELIEKIDPSIVYVSGRMDADYLKASLLARKKGAKIVSGFDAQWDSSLKKKIIAAAGRWLYQRYFDYIWVPGPYQYEFARKIGYNRDRIIWNLLSAETSQFEKIYTHQSARSEFNKCFVFVGRFAEVKGIDILIDAFLKTKQTSVHNWKLMLIGNGPLKSSFPQHKDILIHDFLQPDKLRETTQDGGVFVLPSNYEPWGVVVHEYTTAGFPVICSSACGAAVTLVKHGYNGFVFKTNNSLDLQKSMEDMIHKSDEELKLMSHRSNEISKSITPQISSASLMSILK